MTVAEADWWRAQIPDGENVLWASHPDQGFFSPRYGWAYKAVILGLVIMWTISPWILDTVRDFWKLACVTLLMAFTMWADRCVRAQRVYVVTSKNAWQFNKHLKSKPLKIDRFLNFRTRRRAIVFDRHPFFSFENLPDPHAALKALNQAREAST
ncbi:MAG: hypothetical protein AB3N21_13325 [Ruegeria sp.]|uniref:hypothetical protein n=1 Tax=Ruegeria sp. TaxID=1879320 RepID=UPI00349E635C